MDWRWRPFSTRIMPMVTETIGGIQTQEETMYAITQRQNGSAEYRVGEALAEETMRRARAINWPVVGEVFFTAVVFVAIVLSIWKPWQ